MAKKSPKPKEKLSKREKLRRSGQAFSTVMGVPVDPTTGKPVVGYYETDVRQEKPFDVNLVNCTVFDIGICEVKYGNRQN